MKLNGIIKSAQAAIAAGGADITQKLVIEIFEDSGTDNFKDLRDMMQKPLLITLETKQLEIGERFGKDKDRSPMADGAVETTAIDRPRGRKKSAVHA